MIGFEDRKMESNGHERRRSRGIDVFSSFLFFFGESGVGLMFGEQTE